LYHHAWWPRYNTDMSVELLAPRHSQGAEVERLPVDGWRLMIPEGKAGEYLLAQLDDYRTFRRDEFPRVSPLTLVLSARASSQDLPGTWGFGLWNDPFGAGLAHGGMRMLPALPEAAWFFFASGQNYLSFREDMPANGALAGVFHSVRLPVLPFLPMALGTPFLLIKPISRLARRVAAEVIQEDALALDLGVTEWHQYRLEWLAEEVRFFIDGQEVHRSSISPRPPLGVVIWIDNQFAAWQPDGSLGYGTLQTTSAWIEVKDLEIR
jgi:hypothetical protein